VSNTLPHKQVTFNFCLYILRVYGITDNLCFLFMDQYSANTLFNCTALMNIYSFMYYSYMHNAQANKSNSTEYPYLLEGRYIGENSIGIIK
jgi:hypothetical protein